MKLTEESFAEKVVDYLDGWEVYQEVSLPGGIADIVAVQGRRVWIIETKLSFGFAVLSQAYRWRPYAHWISVAVPRAKRSRDERDLATRICKDYGIGIVTGDHHGNNWYNTLEILRPSLFRHAKASTVLGALHDQHKTFAKAGNCSGDRWTPYKQTCRNILVYVENHPGCTLTEMLDAIEHHYASRGSARGSIAHWALRGRVAGVKCQMEGKSYRFYPK